MQLAGRTESMAELRTDCDTVANLKTLSCLSLEVDLTFCQHGFDIEVTLDSANSLSINTLEGAEF